LETRVITYYATETKKEKKKTLSFEYITRCDSLLTKGERENVFVIQTRDRPYVFQAPNTRQKDLWLWALRDIVQQNNAT